MSLKNKKGPSNCIINYPVGAGRRVQWVTIRVGQIPTGSCAASTVTIDDLNYVTSDTKDLGEIKETVG